MTAISLRRVLCFGLLTWSVTAAAQSQPADRAATEAIARRVAERVRALEREADRLAGESRTLVGDLRRLEIERDLAIVRVKEAEGSVQRSEREAHDVSAKLAGLEQQRVAALPDLTARFVELYKGGRGSYARMIANARNLREFGRATRAVASLVHTNGRRMDEHRRLLESLRGQRAALQRTARELAARRSEMQKARAAADRAVRARAALLTQIDARRDLNAQFAGELMVAHQKLQAALAGMRAGRGDVAHVSVPLGPFRGALDWPVVGPLAARFGQANHDAAGDVRNGIEIAAPEGTPVHVVHPGAVSFADSFSGYGTLVIVDHGADHFSLYGYLSSLDVARGEHVQAGQQLGRIGLAPAGPAALYFELRIDGRSVDPVQWLRKR